MEPKCSAAAEAWLAANTGWNAAQRRALAGIVPDLLDRLDRLDTPDGLQPRPAGPSWLLALGGPPGTGKSTLARLLADLRRDTRPRHPPLQILSLDDYYLPRDERVSEASRIHSLLARRGVPGTHNFDLLARHVGHLRSGAPGPVNVPVFDKGRDDRAAAPRVIDTGGRAAPVLLEGWFAGTPAETEAALATVRSRYEREHDTDGRWARAVNAQLARFDAWLTAQDAVRWHLAAPSWDQVRAWRWTQEQELPPARRMLQGPDAVDEFLAPFERLARHQFDGAADWADLVITLDRAHRPHLQSGR